MDPKAIASQLRTLASDPDNQTYIVGEESCMKGLVGFLNVKDEDVVVISLQALQFLSSHPSNQGALSKYPGLLAKVAGLIDHDNVKIATVAKDILDNLQNFVNKQDDMPLKPKKIDNNSSAKPNYLYNIPLQISELSTQGQAKAIEGVLLNVKGVVSVTTELYQRQVIVYTRENESDIIPALVTAVKTLGMTAIAGQGQDRLQDKAAPQYLNEKGASNRPSYLNKDENTPANAAAPQYMLPAGLRGVRKGSVVEFSQSIRQNTLEARLQRQKRKQQEQQQKKTQVKSFFGAVTSYFW